MIGNYPNYLLIGASGLTYPAMLELSYVPLFPRLKKDHGKSPQQEREHKDDTDAEHDSDEFISVLSSAPNLVIVCPSPRDVLGSGLPHSRH